MRSQRPRSGAFSHREDWEYGPIGSVFALMAYLIAVGVVVILGAVVGLTWRDLAFSPRAAFRRRT